MWESRIEFPWVIDVRHVVVGTVEINVVVVIAIEKRADLERAAERDEVTDCIGMAKRDIGGVIGAETRAANRHASHRTFPPRQIEDVVRNDTLVGVMRAHAIGGMNLLVVKAVEIDRVRAINRDLAAIDISSDGVG